MKRKKLIIILLLFTFLIFSLVFLITNPVFFYSQNAHAANVNVERIRGDVYRLSHTKTARNSANVESLNEAADHIKAEFSKSGATVEEQKYMVDSIEYKNLICSFGTENAERIIVGAHYDVCYDQPGADDNASGVAGLLELARLLSAEKPNLKYRIDLVAYTLEEPPFFREEQMGSYVHAKSMHDKNIKVKAMICLEMIGYFSEQKNSQGFPMALMRLLYPNKGNFITVVATINQWGLTRKVKRNMLEGSAIDVRSINAPAVFPGIDLSDHLNYWKFGYPAVMINNTGFFRNGNYHKPTDTPETLDYKKMAEVIKGVYNAVVKME